MNLEIAAADEEVDIDILHSFQVLQSGIYVVQVAMCTTLYGNLRIKSLRSATRILKNQLIE